MSFSANLYKRGKAKNDFIHDLPPHAARDQPRASDNEACVRDIHTKPAPIVEQEGNSCHSTGNCDIEQRNILKSVS